MNLYILYRKKLNDINHYMKQRNFNSETQVKVQRYIEYLHGEEKNGYQRGENLFKTLSSNLKDEVNLEINLKHIRSIYFFKKNFSNDFLVKLSLNTQERIFASGEILV